MTISEFIIKMSVLNISKFPDFDYIVLCVKDRNQCLGREFLCSLL